MRKFISLAVATSIMALAPAAQASTPVYTPAAPWVLEGAVAVNKGIPLNCIVTLTLNSSSDSTITLAPDTVNDPFGLNYLCPSVIPDPIPASDIDYNTTTKELTLQNVFIQTISAGDCQGDIVGTWDVSTQTLSVSGSMPAATAGNPCTMLGVLDLLTPSPGDIS